MSDEERLQRECERALGAWGSFGQHSWDPVPQCWLMAEDRLDEIIRGIEEIERLPSAAEKMERLRRVATFFQDENIMDVIDFEEDEANAPQIMNRLREMSRTYRKGLLPQPLQTQLEEIDALPKFSQRIAKLRELGRSLRTADAAVRAQAAPLVAMLDEIEGLESEAEQRSRFRTVQRMFHRATAKEIRKGELDEAPVDPQEWIQWMLGRLAVALVPYLLRGMPEGSRVNAARQAIVAHQTPGGFIDKLNSILEENTRLARDDVLKGRTTSWIRRLFGAGNPSLPRCHHNFTENLCGRQEPWCRWSYDDQTCHLNRDAGLGSLTQLGTRVPWQVEQKRGKWIRLFDPITEREEDQAAVRLMTELWDEGLAPWLGERELDLQRHLRSTLSTRAGLMKNLAVALFMSQLRQANDSNITTDFIISPQALEIYRIINRLNAPQQPSADQLRQAGQVLDTLRLEMADIPDSWLVSAFSQGKLDAAGLEKLVRRFAQESLTFNATVPRDEQESREDFLARRRLRVRCDRQLNRQDCETGNCRWEDAGLWRRWLGVKGEPLGTCQVDLTSPSLRRGVEAAQRIGDESSLSLLRQQITEAEYRGLMPKIVSPSSTSSSSSSTSSSSSSSSSSSAPPRSTINASSQPTPLAIVEKKQPLAGSVQVQRPLSLGTRA